MTALPSALACHASRPSRSAWPFDWTAKSTMRGRAAEGRRPRARLEGVLGERAAERQLHVGVDVDAARDDVLAGRVDRLVGRHAGGRPGPRRSRRSSRRRRGRRPRYEPSAVTTVPLAMSVRMRLLLALGPPATAGRGRSTCGHRSEAPPAPEGGARRQDRGVAWSLACVACRRPAARQRQQRRETEGIPDAAKPHDGRCRGRDRGDRRRVRPGGPRPARARASSTQIDPGGAAPGRTATPASTANTATPRPSPVRLDRRSTAPDASERRPAGAGQRAEAGGPARAPGPRHAGQRHGEHALRELGGDGEQSPARAGEPPDVRGTRVAPPGSVDLRGAARATHADTGRDPTA